MKNTILFLAANPADTDRLALDREARAVHVDLERSGFRDTFEICTRWAIRPLDLLRELRRARPVIVHFCGHGSNGVVREPWSGPLSRDPPDIPGDGEHGLYFSGPDGHAQLVPASVLQETFGAVGSSVKVVVLNACYTAEQAHALTEHIDCVVGMPGSISDEAARMFAIGFYGGLGERESVAAAFRQGCAAISLEGVSYGGRPSLAVRSGVDADCVVLAPAR
jgi:hypothetical protein